MSLVETLQQHGLDTSSLVIPDHQREGDGIVYLLRVPAHEAIIQWDALRALAPETEYWPIVGWDRFKRPWWIEEPTEEIIQAGIRLDVAQWFVQEGIASTRIATVDSAVGNPSFTPFTYRIHLGRFADTPPSLAPIALVPTSVSWQIPAYLRLAEDTQLPYIHVGVMKYWHERWGAEPVAMHGSVEMKVSRPPENLESALALAKEQYIYCPDIVDQHIGSISMLARLLVNSKNWWFWWD